MNLPNKLSLTRIILIPFLIVALVVGGAHSENPGVIAWCRLTALLLFVAGALTDWYDGKIARERNLVTDLGALIDPLADKLLVVGTFVVLIELEVYASWLIVVILSREFLVTGLRMLAASKGVVMSADKWGKHKTAWQMATIITALVVVTAREFARAAGVWEDFAWMNQSAERLALILTHIPMTVAILLTVLSGSIYLTRNTHLLKE